MMQVLLPWVMLFFGAVGCWLAFETRQRRKLDELLVSTRQDQQLQDRLDGPSPLSTQVQALSLRQDEDRRLVTEQFTALHERIKVASARSSDIANSIEKAVGGLQAEMHGVLERQDQCRRDHDTAVKQFEEQSRRIDRLFEQHR